MEPMYVGNRSADRSNFPLKSMRSKKVWPNRTVGCGCNWILLVSSAGAIRDQKCPGGRWPVVCIISCAMRTHLWPLCMQHLETFTTVWPCSLGNPTENGPTIGMNRGLCHSLFRPVLPACIPDQSQRFHLEPFFPFPLWCTGYSMTCMPCRWHFAAGAERKAIRSCSISFVVCLHFFWLTQDGRNVFSKAVGSCHTVVFCCISSVLYPHTQNSLQLVFFCIFLLRLGIFWTDNPKSVDGDPEKIESKKEYWFEASPLVTNCHFVWCLHAVFADEPICFWNQWERFVFLPP